MDKNKLKKQVVIIVLIIIGFVLFDISFYNLVTKNYINKYGDAMRENQLI